MGGDYGITWWDRRLGKADMFYARLSGLGAEIGDDRLTSNMENVTDPSAVWTGQELGVAFSVEPSVGPASIELQRLDRDGVALAVVERISPMGQNASDVSIAYDAPAPRQISGPGALAGDPILVSAAGNYAIAWPDARHGATEIYFARVCR